MKFSHNFSIIVFLIKVYEQGIDHSDNFKFAAKQKYKPNPKLNWPFWGRTLNNSNHVQLEV